MPLQARVAKHNCVAESNSTTCTQSTAIIQHCVQTSGLKSVSVPSHSNDAHHDDDEGRGRRDDGGRLQDLAFAAALVVEFLVALFDGSLCLFRRCHGFVRLSTSRLGAYEAQGEYAVFN